MPGHWKRNRNVVAPSRSTCSRTWRAQVSGAADDEAAALGELLEGLPQRVALGQHLALAPLHVGLVLVLEVRPHGAHRGLVVRPDVELLDDRDLGRGRQAAALALGVVEDELALELVELRVRVEQPGVGEPGGAQDGVVVVRGEPDRRPRAPASGAARAAARASRKPCPSAVTASPSSRRRTTSSFCSNTASRFARQAERVVLLLAVAEPEPEHEAAVRDGVERGRVLRDLDGVEQREQEDARRPRASPPPPPRCAPAAARAGASGTAG